MNKLKKFIIPILAFPIILGSVLGYYEINFGSGVNFNSTTNKSVGKNFILLDTAPQILRLTTDPLADTFDGCVAETSVLENETLLDPTDTTNGKIFTVINSGNSTQNITINSIVIAPEEHHSFYWDGVNWTSSVGGGGSAFTKILDANNALYPSTNPAGAFSRNSHPIIVFDDTTAESVIFTNSAGSDYGGDDITVNIEWVAETATTGGVTWGVSFEVNAASGNDIDSDSFAAQQTGTSSANATSGVITITSITLTQAQADAIAAGDYFRMEVERVTGDVGDDMVGDAQILKITLTN